MSIQVSLRQLAAVQSHQERIRNVCILAHVDHGKTTLSDHLIASNGLIHPKLVGELRYLDARDDEQARGITMKSSAISLMHISGRHPGSGQGVTEEQLQKAFLVNLIDSPGHVDFCSEVSTAARLSDGALVVVDCVEGVCIQTHAVLRQAFQERVCPVLVLNKIDRLVTEQQLTPYEAYEHLKRIIGDVNRVYSAFQSEHHLKEADAILAFEDEHSTGGGSQAPEAETEDLDFCPVKGNVAFASAFDGWGFRLGQFAAIVAAKLGAKPEALKRALWGEFYFQPKTKSVSKKRPPGVKAQPMFVQFVLEPLWKAYSVLGTGVDQQALLGQMVKSLSLSSVTEKDLKHPDVKIALKSVLRAWLPLSDVVLGMATEHLPSPSASAPDRLSRLLPGLNAAAAAVDSSPGSMAAIESVQRVRGSVGRSGGAASDPVVVFVSKMVSVPVATLPRNPGDPPPGAGEVFLAFGRVFSGVVHEGQRLHVLSSGYDPLAPDDGQRRVGVVRALYLMMGTGLECLSSVPAGNVLALEGFADSILKTATLSSTPACPPMAPMTFQSAPVVRVALEPTLPSDIGRLRHGLSLLNRADPMVEVTVLDTGEHVLGAAGEVHLETCIKDLRERFARIELQVSPPLVAFRESVADGAAEAKVDSGMSSRPVRAVEVTTANGVCVLRIRALPLPDGLASALEGAAEQLRQPATCGKLVSKKDGTEASLARDRLQAVATDLDDGGKTSEILAKAWCFGPRNCGPNVLICGAAGPESLWDLPAGSLVKVGGSKATARGENGDSVAADDKAEPEGPPASTRLHLGEPKAAAHLGLVDGVAEGGGVVSGLPEKLQHVARSVEAGVSAGFQMATSAGPLCDEPMWGVAFEVEAHLVMSGDGGALKLAEDVYGPFSGQMISAAREGFRRAMIEAGPRLVEAMYLCEVSTSSEALSGVYAVLGQRRSRIQREDMREGSDTFIIQTYLPVEASFGFAAEIRRRSSGAASPSLMLSHWERLQVDPYFVPTTEEEREEFGEQGQGFTDANLARKFIDQVRRRKGIMVEEKIVESATKQRTLARKV